MNSNDFWNPRGHLISGQKTRRCHNLYRFSTSITKISTGTINIWFGKAVCPTGEPSEDGMKELPFVYAPSGDPSKPLTESNITLCFYNKFPHLFKHNSPWTLLDFSSMLICQFVEWISNSPHVLSSFCSAYIPTVTF